MGWKVSKILFENGGCVWGNILKWNKNTFKKKTTEGFSSVKEIKLIEIVQCLWRMWLIASVFLFYK